MSDTRTPRRWTKTALGQLVSAIEAGKSFRCIEKPPSAGAPGVVKVSAVTWGSFDEQESKTCPDEKQFNPRFQICVGDFLISRANTIDFVGACVIVGSVTKRLMLSDKILRIVMAEEWKRWCLWFLRSKEGRAQIEAHASGNQLSMRNIGQDGLLAIEIPMAPRGEQHRIVEAIESYLTRLDDAATTLERVQRNLKRYRASVLKAAVEGRLVSTEADLARAEGRSYEPAMVLLERILAERRLRWEKTELAKLKAKNKAPENDKWKAKYVEPIGPDTTDLPELPEGWCWASVDQLAAHESNSLTDGPFGSNLKSDHYTSSGPRVIRLQNIGDGDFLDFEAHVSSEHFARLRKHSVEPGDVVIASLGTELPRACVVPDWLGAAMVKADCLRFAPHRDLMMPWFAMHALNASPSRKRAEDLVHGVGRPRIGLTLLRQFPLPLPPLAEQRRVLDEVERLLSVVDTTTIAARHNSARCSRLRQSILKWAFEGRLVDQDPNDEPASVLLERIRAERETAHADTSARRRPRTSQRSPSPHIL